MERIGIDMRIKDIRRFKMIPHMGMLEGTRGKL